MKASKIMPMIDRTLKFLIWLIFCTGISSASDIISLNGYVLDLFGRPVNGSLFVQSADSLYEFPVMADGSVHGTIITSVDKISGNVPKYFKLENNYPNPFDDETRFDISSSIATEGHIELYNVLGQKVFSQPIRLDPGRTTYELKASLAAGAYFARVITPYGIENKKWIDFSGQKNKPGQFLLSRQSYNAEKYTIQKITQPNKSNSVFEVYAKGISNSGDSLIVYQAMREKNQDPENENIATASYKLGDSVFTPMLLGVEQLVDPFILYALDESVSLDTLTTVCAPFFRASWSDISINRLNRIYYLDSLGAAVNDSVLERQLTIIDQFKDVININTPFGIDSLLAVSQDTISFIDSLETGSRLWFVNNEFEPSYGRLVQFIDGNWQITYGESRVRENSSWPVLIKNYTASFAVALADYSDLDNQEFIDLAGLIAKPDGKIWRIDQRGTAYIRAGLIFKGKQFRIPDQ